MNDELTLTARWVLPVAGPPLGNGLVVIAGDTIAAVEPDGARTTDLDLGNSAIIPGLVNAHTHLDLSGLRGKVPPEPDFIGWLRQIIAQRRAQSAGQVEADIRSGLSEALRFGTTLIGDIAAEGASRPALMAAPIWSVVFREIIGLLEDRAAKAWAASNHWLRAQQPTSQCQPGLSPHAPYSARSSVLQATAAAATPFAVHLAESLGEGQLLKDRTGPFVPFLKELGAWHPDGLASGYDHVLRLVGGKCPALLVHCNYLPPDAPIPPNATIVYCPRTHAAFGHPPHPFREFLRRGVRVALGTDSLASNPNLDLLAEARFIHERCPDFPADQLLRMATLSGAEALGCAERTGSLTPGKSADLVVVPLPNIALTDPYALVFEPGELTQAPRRTMWRGQWRDQRTGTAAPAT